jgi:MFS superfamily sulfate permease-like transporter
MVKPAEVREVWRHNRFHAALMIYTAVMVAVTDFLIGVLSALALYAVLHRFLDRPHPSERHDARESEAAPHATAADAGDDLADVAGKRS